MGRVLIGRKSRFCEDPFEGSAVRQILDSIAQHSEAIKGTGETSWLFT